MPVPLRLKGQGASPGYARGTAHVPPRARAPSTATVSSGKDRERLLLAVDNAVSALRSLAEGSDLESAAILEFQIEMLRDPAILEPSLARIREGESAAFAWASAMDDYIRGFEAADDEHIRAHGGDMLDIKNQVLRSLNGEAPPDFPRGSVFVGRDIAPSVFLAHDWTGGGAVVLEGGSVASHVAILARSRGVPMVVGVGDVTIDHGTELFVHGDEGYVHGVDDADETPAVYTLTEPDSSQKQDEPSEACETADGVAVTLRANIDHPNELRGLSPRLFDGIGLLRTEYLFPTSAELADEERQEHIYRETLIWAQGRPVTIRLFDFGADKPLPGTQVDLSSYLGLRGIRLLLARPELLRTQARALMRAAPAGRLRVLVPMVTSPAEVEETARIFTEEAATLSERRIDHAISPLGIMVEVPAAALMPEAFRQATFFSFGTNDLAQYIGAAARDSAEVSHLHEASREATLRLLRHTVPLALATGKPVSICGDLTADPSALPDLLACGFREFSMAPARMPLVRKTLSGLNTGGGKARG
ncbi:putative PEP-binding protein [Ensifer sp. 4252]|uniref:putative PEP-binding protein n=1 Tax=Ensifer sp. 4252 TaxID=3373915 RepID=UPI003D1DF51B